MGEKKIELEFDLPEEVSLMDIIYEILEKNNLEGTIEERIHEFESGESRALIIRDAALVMYRKKIPEDKLAEFLAKHLRISKETAKKVILEIRERIVPYIREEKSLSTQEIILRKIRGASQKQNIQPTTDSKEKIKTVEIKNVEENAEALKKEGRRGPDKYREVFE